jgi:hypothetical protein
VRRRHQAHARGRSSRRSCRATRSTCSPSRSCRWRQRVSEALGVRRARRSSHAHSYAELSRELLENVLDMLEGRPSQEPAELRPRIVWDRVGGTIRARGARQLGDQRRHIPDRGLPWCSRRAARRRARRGDGLGRAPARPSCRRLDLASRRSGATA